MAGHHRGLVLQGGGALGAFELGAARAIYSERSTYRPDVISGVSIGAISAALLARPAKGMSGLEALEAFWSTVTTCDLKGLPATALFANPRFYVPAMPPAPFGVSIYDTSPLLRTLEGLVDEHALADPQAEPRLIMSATDIAKSTLVLFDSGDPAAKDPLTLRHVLASGSLPPNFPATRIGQTSYWDGGVFDNTPLGAVIDALDGPDPAVLVINLFPKEVPLPTSMAEVLQTFSNLLFVNKTESDMKLLGRFNEVVDFLDALAARYPAEELEALPGWKNLRRYRKVHAPIQVTRTLEARPLEGSDFSRDGIVERASDGWEQTVQALQATGFWSSAGAV
jgi:predicted acylesterase/phospholipase RssA